MEYEVAFECINRAIDTINKRYQKIANKYELTANGLKIIEILSRKGVTQTYLCNELYLAKSTIHSTILLLEKRNIIKYLDLNNKEKNIVLTREGLDLAKDIEKDIIKFKKDIILKIDKEDLKHIINACFKI